MSIKRAYSPRDIKAKNYRTLPWEGRWKAAFGNPTMTDSWFVCGPSANGKSSFVMQLAKELCNYGLVLYLSYEEGISQSFKTRLLLFGLDKEQSRFRVVVSDTLEELKARLKRPKSPKFVIVDSYQKTYWTFEQAVSLINEFPRKCFIFISQEYKGQPMGKPAMRLRYEAGVKVRVNAFKAVCQGRFTTDPGSDFVVWEDGVLRTSNQLINNK